MPFHRSFRLSFRLKTILGIALIEAILLAILIASVMDYLYDTNEAQLQRYARVATASLAATNKDAVLGLDLARLQASVEDLQRNPGIYYARILDADDRVLAASGPHVAHEAPFVADRRLDAVTDGVFDASAPIEAGGAHFGAVQIGLDVANLQATMGSARRFSFTIAGIEMALVALFSLALGTWLTRQLVQLKTAADRIGAGELGFQAPVRGGDELAETAAAFNAMSAQLQEARVRQARYEADLIAARDAAESASRAKSRFLAVMSHELRTPLNGVLGMVQLLETTPLTDEQGEYVRTIRQSGHWLLKELSDILEYSRLEGGVLQMEWKAYPLEHLLSLLQDRWAPRARARGLTWALERDEGLPELVEGSLSGVSRVLDHLLDNALRFTERGGVSLRVVRAGEHIRLGVSDTGCGVPGDQHERIFEPFYQVEMGTTRSHDGMGLGLAHARALAEAMGGRIWVEDTATCGAAFWLELPLAAKPLAAGQEG